jgi:hypothetical protein
MFGIFDINGFCYAADFDTREEALMVLANYYAEGGEDNLHVSEQCDHHNDCELDTCLGEDDDEFGPDRGGREDFHADG